MITLKTENLFKIEAPHGLNQKQVNDQKQRISELLEGFYSRDQDFHQVIDNGNHLIKIRQLVSIYSNKFSDIVVCGIGGSALGTSCLYESLGHFYKKRSHSRKKPRLYVLDNIDPEWIGQTREVIDLKDTLFIIVTKSGATPETLSLFFYFKNELEKQGVDPKSQMVLITDPKKGFLRKVGDREGWTTLEHANVGGRFSVLSSVSLFPAALIGLDIEDLVVGARNMRDRFLSLDWETNLPFQLATYQYLLTEKGKNIHVLWSYSQRLIRFLDWYKQLLAESIGKAENRKGEIVHVGITPVGALGVTDQHSQSQLYNEGPYDKFFIFIDVKDRGKEITIPHAFPKESSLGYLKGVSFNQLMLVEKKGTEEALTENNRPNITIELDRVCEKTFGELFFLFEGAVAFLGEYLGINAYNQPGVERSKEITRKILS